MREPSRAATAAFPLWRAATRVPSSVAIAGADDPVLPSPSDDVPAVEASPADFVASLTGGQEVPGNASPAFGVAEFRLSDDGTSLSYSARVFGLANPTVAHLHQGAIGVSGSIVVPLEAPSIQIAVPPLPLTTLRSAVVSPPIAVPSAS